MAHETQGWSWKPLVEYKETSVENQVNSRTEILNSPGSSMHGPWNSRLTLKCRGKSLQGHFGGQRMYEFGIYHFPELTFFYLNQRKSTHCLCFSRKWKSSLLMQCDTMLKSVFFYLTHINIWYIMENDSRLVNMKYSSVVQMIERWRKC